MYSYYCRSCGYTFTGTKDERADAERGHRRLHRAGVAFMPIGEYEHRRVVFARPALAESLVTKGTHAWLDMGEKVETK